MINNVLLLSFLQGDQQHIALQFPGAVVVSEIGLCFQGGFVGKECRLEGRSIASGVTISLCDFFPENINSVQISFSLLVFIFDRFVVDKARVVL